MDRGGCSKKDCGVNLGLFDTELCVGCDGNIKKKGAVYIYIQEPCSYCFNRGKGDCPEC